MVGTRTKQRQVLQNANAENFNVPSPSVRTPRKREKQIGDENEEKKKLKVNEGKEQRIVQKQFAKLQVGEGLLVKFLKTYQIGVKGLGIVCCDTKCVTGLLNVWDDAKAAVSGGMLQEWFVVKVTSLRPNKDYEVTDHKVVINVNEKIKKARYVEAKDVAVAITKDDFNGVILSKEARTLNEKKLVEICVGNKKKESLLLTLWELDAECFNFNDKDFVTVKGLHKGKFVKTSCIFQSNEEFSFDMFDFDVVDLKSMDKKNVDNYMVTLKNKVVTFPNTSETFNYTFEGSCVVRFPFDVLEQYKPPPGTHICNLRIKCYKKDNRVWKTVRGIELAKGVTDSPLQDELDLVEIQEDESLGDLLSENDNNDNECSSSNATEMVHHSSIEVETAKI